MFFKNCPFCNKAVKERYDNVTNRYVLECENCKKKNITIKIENNSLEELQKLWNLRITSINDDKVIGKTNYGYLIIYNGDILECNDSHPEEILNYLGINSDYNTFNYEEICRKIGILRVSHHCGCVMLDMPNKITKIQIDKCIEIMYNYVDCVNFNIYLENKSKMISLSSINECILYLDKLG